MSTQEVVRDVQSQQDYNPLAKQKAAAKLSRIPVKVEQAPLLKKPDWIRVKAGSPSTRFYEGIRDGGAARGGLFGRRGCSAWSLTRPS